MRGTPKDFVFEKLGASMGKFKQLADNTRVTLKREFWGDYRFNNVACNYTYELKGTLNGIHYNIVAVVQENFDIDNPSRLVLSLSTPSGGITNQVIVENINMITMMTTGFIELKILQYLKTIQVKHIIDFVRYIESTELNEDDLYTFLTIERLACVGCKNKPYYALYATRIAHTKMLLDIEMGDGIHINPMLTICQLITGDKGVKNLLIEMAHGHASSLRGKTYSIDSLLMLQNIQSTAYKGYKTIER